MEKYEIYFPSTKNSREKIYREEGENWFNVLEVILSEEDPDVSLSDFICDIKDEKTVHVTDRKTGRKILIKQFDEKRTDSFSEEEIGRKVTPSKNRDEILASLFEEVFEAFEKKNETEGLEFFLDLALKYIPAESGSIASSSLSSRTLKFIATRGPKADAVKGLTIPMGKGIAGFSALRNCLVAVSDVQKDPRYFSEISEKIGYETQSIISAPVAESGKTFGIIELINKKESSSFNEDELEILRFIGEKIGEYMHMIWDQKNNDLEES